MNDSTDYPLSTTTKVQLILNRLQDIADLMDKLKDYASPCALGQSSDPDKVLLQMHYHLNIVGNSIDEMAKHLPTPRQQRYLLANGFSPEKLGQLSKKSAQKLISEFEDDRLEKAQARDREIEELLQ